MQEEEKAITFIKSTSTLTHLSFHVGNGHRGLSSLDAINSLAALPALRSLKGMEFTADFLQDLPDNSFLAMSELVGGYIGSLAKLPSLFPHLSDLRLRLSDRVDGQLGAIGALSNLTRLEFDFAESSTIQAAELVAIARGCPQLKTVLLLPAGSIPLESPCLRGIGIDDTIIEQLARALPNLRSLDLLVAGLPALTYQAVIFLAHHCPSLSHILITADLLMSDLIEGFMEVGDTPLPNLEVLGLVLHQEIDIHGYKTAGELCD